MPDEPIDTDKSDKVTAPLLGTTDRGEPFVVYENHGEGEGQ